MLSDYLLKVAGTNSSFNFSLPEFIPGNFFEADEIYPRKPFLESDYPTFLATKSSKEIPGAFYPNRKKNWTSVPPAVAPAAPDDGPNEFLSFLLGGGAIFKVTYLILCIVCGLAFLFLFVVGIVKVCRNCTTRKRSKTPFRFDQYPHHDPHSLKRYPWLHQQMHNQFLLENGAGLHPHSSRSVVDSCTCHCSTELQGTRNQEHSSRPIPSSNRNSSLNLCGLKTLPFGVASSLKFQPTLGRVTVPQPRPDSWSPGSDFSDTFTSYIPGDVRRGNHFPLTSHRT